MSAQKPFAQTNLMTNAVMDYAGVWYPSDHDPFRGKVELSDYDKLPSLTSDKPAGYPLKAPYRDVPNITNVKKGTPPFMIIEEPSNTDIPSEALEEVHNGPAQMAIPPGQNTYQRPQPVTNDVPSLALQTHHNNSGFI